MNPRLRNSLIAVFGVIAAGGAYVGVSFEPGTEELVISQVEALVVAAGALIVTVTGIISRFRSGPPE